MLCLLNKGYLTYFSYFLLTVKHLIMLFILLLGFNAVSLFVNHDLSSEGLYYILKNALYIFNFILMGALVSYRLTKKDFPNLILYSNVALILFFNLVATVIFYDMGRFFIYELLTGFFSGDGKSIRFDLYLSLFNSQSGADDFNSSLRNTLIGSFVYVVFTSLYIKRFFDKGIKKWLIAFCLYFSYFIILSSLSRSNILALILGFFIVFVSRSITKKSKTMSHATQIKIVFGTILLLAGLVVFIDKFVSVLSLITGRLAELGDDARWELNKEAIFGIADNLIIGNGPGSTLKDGHTVHNFILGSGYQAGIIGLILASLFYVSILKKTFKGRVYFNDSELWLSGLMALPLLRSMTSGNAGTLSLIEWFCIAFFLAALNYKSILKKKAIPQV